MSENGFPKTAATLRKELGVPEDFDAAAVKKYTTLLEKKWTTTGRLQKKASQSCRLSLEFLICPSIYTGTNFFLIDRRPGVATRSFAIRT